jgi:arsenate reductase-like glutaredoxin family protein
MQAAIQKLLSKNQVILEKAKKKLKDEGAKSVLKYKNKLPTPNQLKDKFSTSQVCTRSAVNKSEKTYRKLKNFAKKVQNALEKSQKALEKLQALVNKVLSIIAKIAALIATVDIIIGVLQKIVAVAKILVNGVGLIPPPATAPSGPIILADKAATFAEGKISILKIISRSFVKALDFPRNKANNLLALILKGIAAIVALLNLVKMLIQMLETLFLLFLNSCAVSNPGGNGSQTQNTVNGQTPEEFLEGMQYPGYDLNKPVAGGDPFSGLNDKDAFDYSDPLAELYDSIITNLQLSGQKEIIEKIFNAKFEMVGYKRYKV